MKVGIVCPYDWSVPGGVQAHIHDLALELMDRGHTVNVLTPTLETKFFLNGLRQAATQWRFHTTDPLHASLLDLVRQEKCGVGFVRAILMFCICTNH